MLSACDGVVDDDEKWLHLPATFAFRVRGKRTHRCTQSSLMTCRGGCGVREGGANMVRIAVGVGMVVRRRWRECSVPHLGMRQGSCILERSTLRVCSDGV